MNNELGDTTPNITWGDIATDLSSAWMLLSEKNRRENMFASYGKVSRDTIYRAEGWAIVFGTMFLDTELVNNPRHARLGRRILENLTNNPKGT